MGRRPFLQWFTSPRVTVGLLLLLAALLLLTVALPQEATLGASAYGDLLERSPWARVVLGDLGLGRLSTHPLFVATLALFFLNLTAVLISRIGVTWRRTRLEPRSADGLAAWAELEEALRGPLPERWSPGRVSRILLGHGFKVRRPGERVFWAVKHRTAPLGFLLFHLSFFLLCAGGLAIHYTRFVGSLRLTEGQRFDGEYARVERRPRLGGPPAPAFLLERVEARTEGGMPVELRASLRFLLAGSSTTRESRVNQPARWGPSILLVERAGLAPVLWVQDENGFTLDRLAVPIEARGEESPPVPLADGRWLVMLSTPERGDLPQREELAAFPVRLAVFGAGETQFEGDLVRGGSADLEGGRIVLEEMRYWAGFRVVSERGGGLLIAGFVAGILGLIWRLGLYRRQVVVTWDEREFRLVGRGEYFGHRFRSELEAIHAALLRGEEV